MLNKPPDIFKDTVVALEALSKYTALTVGPLDLMIDVAVGNYRHRLNVNRRDALVLKTTEVRFKKKKIRQTCL